MKIMKQMFVWLLCTLPILGCSIFSGIQSPRIESGKKVSPAQDSLTTPTILNPLPPEYPVRLVSVEVDPVFKDLLRPHEKGWLGSDVAYSIPLSDKKILWLFGDTLIGTMDQGRRMEGAEFIHNTIGIQDISESLPGNMEFFWRNEEGRSVEFFPTRVNKHYVKSPKQVYDWPSMGAVLNDHLFLFGYRVEVGENNEFELPTTLIRISNPLDPPLQWDQESHDLGLGDLHKGFHSAVYIKDPYIYFLGYQDPIYIPQWRNAVLARAKISDLYAGGLADVYEFWVMGDQGPMWGKDPTNLVALFRPGVTETGIQYIPEWGLYVCTTYHINTPDIYITVAPELTGPWSKPVSIYQVPEYKVSFPINSYAVRPHPEFSTKPGELIISYATNGDIMDLKPLFTKEGAEIYFPRFIRVQLALNNK